MNPRRCEIYRKTVLFALQCAAARRKASDGDIGRYREARRRVILLMPSSHVRKILRKIATCTAVSRLLSPARICRGNAAVQRETRLVDESDLLLFARSISSKFALLVLVIGKRRRRFKVQKLQKDKTRIVETFDDS